MLFAVTFRYRQREYYTEISTGNEISFGCHKKDTIQIPDAKEHLLVLKALTSEVRATVQPPFLKTSGTVELNAIISLSRQEDAILYVSRITGKSAVSLKLPYHGHITCGRRSTNDLVLSYPIVSGQHFQLLCENGKVHVEDLNSTNHLYLNGRRISKAVMRSGDILSIYTFRFLLENGILYFENMGSALSLSDSLKKQQGVQKEAAVPVLREGRKEGDAQYLNYHISPRIREQLPRETIVLSSAPGQGHTPGGRRGNMAYLISSGAMMAASLATGMISPAMLLARAAGMISPIANMAMYGKMSKEEKRQLEEYEQMRQERYQAYIADQKARIKKIADVQRRIVTGENRSPSECIRTVQDLKRNLWERMPQDSDFLVTRLGKGKAPLCVEVKSRTDMDGFQLTDDDELEQLSGRIIEETRYVDDMPVCVSLKDHQTIGVIGSKEQLYYLLRSMLVEITTQHSYLDVHIIGLFEEDARSRWGVLRWLPHIWDETGQVRYIAFDEKRRHTVCEMLADVVRRRKSETKEDTRKKDQPVLPYYIVIAQNRDLLFAEGIYDELISNNPAYGITTMILAESIYDLPQTCQYLIELGNQPCAYEREKYDERAYFTPDDPVHQVQLDEFSRRMAAIELEGRKGSAAIPSAVTFLQGYHVQTVEELNILKRWENSKPYCTLAAPIGVMAGGKVFSLDIRSGEQSHGPHGLLAGTTGSGKSELLQSWILSMAVNYHPHDVNFVIIDYKGGGMSDLMEPLPHVVGKITNIDRNISRSLISLKSELKRRQELFARCGVNNIDKYQRAYEEGVTKERLPHLIIVTDEFAELKKEEPEFLTELNSVATIGRSLGIHMLLATQKPAGVVTDQIDSNSRFRICMKVQDVADSREMIKRADAARITQAGRAYIRVGEDELFELFQSFYSAAEYTGSRIGGINHENQVRIVGVTGNRITLDKKKQKKRSSEMVDELTAITEHLNALCREQGIEKLPGPWLPELTRWLTLAELQVTPVFDGKEWNRNRKGLSVPIGKYDIPALQKQGIQYLDFMAVGHYGIYGSPGTGKTTLLKTVLTTMGLYYRPEKVNITVIDAGNWSMSEFRGMPHVREVILNQEEEKIARFILRMRKELEARKNAFLKHAVSSLETYWETVSEDLPAMIVMIDNIEPLFEQYMELGDLFTEIAAGGAAFGVYLIYSANSTIGIKYKFMQLIKGCVAFQMAEKGDYGTLVGPIAGISLPNFPGRALMRGNPPVAFQTAMYIDEKEEQLRHEALVKLFADMQKVSQKGDKKTRFTSVKSENMEKKKQAPVKNTGEITVGQKRGMLVIGKDAENLEPAVIDLTENYLLLVSAGDSEKRAKLLAKAAKSLGQSEDYQVLYLRKDNLPEIRKNLEGILNDRQKSYRQHKNEKDFDQEKWLAGFTQICLLVEDLKRLTADMPEQEMTILRRVFTKAKGLGIMILAAASKDIFAVSEPDMLIDAVLAARHVLALDGRPSEYVTAGQELEDHEAGILLDDEEAAWICRGQMRILRM